MGRPNLEIAELDLAYNGSTENLNAAVLKQLKLLLSDIEELVPKMRTGRDDDAYSCLAASLRLTIRGFVVDLAAEEATRPTGPIACNRYQMMGCSVDIDGSSVDPNSCYVCGMQEKDHKKG